MPKDLKRKLIKEHIKYLITTRLDNDDVMAMDTVEKIQNQTKFNGICLLEIPIGYTLEIGKNSVLRQVTSYLNPFISLVEIVAIGCEVKSVYHKQHNKWKGIRSEIISSKPQWIQIIHDKNILNYAFGKEVSPYGLKKRFNLKF